MSVWQTKSHQSNRKTQRIRLTIKAFYGNSTGTKRSLRFTHLKLLELHSYKVTHLLRTGPQLSTPAQPGEQAAHPAQRIPGLGSTSVRDQVEAGHMKRATLWVVEASSCPPRFLLVKIQRLKFPQV